MHSPGVREQVGSEHDLRSLRTAGVDVDAVVMVDEGDDDSAFILAPKVNFRIRLSATGWHNIERGRPLDARRRRFRSGGHGDPRAPPDSECTALARKKGDARTGCVARGRQSLAFATAPAGRFCVRHHGPVTRPPRFCVLTAAGHDRRGCGAFWRRARTQ